MGTGFAKKKKQAKVMQEQIGKMQSDLKNFEVTSTSGNGLVTVTLNGDYELKQIKIKPECVDPEDVEGLEDLIKAAFQDAIKQINAKSMEGLSGKMPGFDGFPKF